MSFKDDDGVPTREELQAIPRENLEILAEGMVIMVKHFTDALQEIDDIAQRTMDRIEADFIAKGLPPL